MIVFNRDIHYIGILCKRGHDYNSTGKSLRYKSCRTCVVCSSEKAKKYSTTELGKHIQQEANNKFSKSNKRKEWLAKYRKSERGKEVFCNAQINYRNTDNGKIVRKRGWDKHAKTDKRKISWKRKNSRRKLQKKENYVFYGKSDLSARFSIFNNICAYCGGDGDTIDHVIPLSCGGADAIHNIVPACRRCNSSKQAKNVDIWYAAQPWFSVERSNKIHNNCGV